MNEWPRDFGLNFAFRLIGECEALNLVELRELALEMLQKYVRTEEQHYVNEGGGGVNDWPKKMLTKKGHFVRSNGTARLRSVAI